MNPFWKRTRLYREWEARVMDHAAAKMGTENTLILEAIRTIDMWQQVALSEKRSARDIAIAFRASLDSPDIDIRDDVDALIVSLSDQVAQMEEQIVV